jgi:hypothetical protein
MADRELDHHKVAEIRQAYETEILSQAIGSVQGRALLWLLIGETGPYSLSYVQGDPGATAFREGQRSIGVGFLQRLYALDRRAFDKIRKEAEDREERFEAQALAFDGE